MTDQRRKLLVELSIDGAIIAERDLAALRVEPSSMTFAPSGDQTDAAATQSLYVIDTSGAGTTAAAKGMLTELSLAPLAATLAPTVPSTLVKTTNTALWNPPSPDPSGLTFVSGSNRLMMVDGEVEETVSGITHFQGANLWEMTLGGSVVRTANISKIAPTVVPMTNEPTGVATDPLTGKYFFSDDGGLKVWTLVPGADGLVGTADDTFTSFDTSIFGGNDPEGVAYDSWNNRIFVSDGVNSEIYQYTPAGALVGQFDVAQYGVTDPESVEFNATSGTLLVLSNFSNRIIIETTLGGALLRTIDVSANNALAPAGLALAPASDGSGASHYYIVDRGIDNDSDPNIVDGKMFEMTAPGPLSGNAPPTVNAGPDQSVVLPGAAVLDGTVTDDGLPIPPGTTSATWAVESGPGTVTFGNPSAVDTTASFNVAGTYVLRLTASDGEFAGADLVTVTATGTGTSAAFDVSVAAGTDDVEESASGGMTMGSSDLELVFDGTNQVVGMRFAGIPIPAGAAIESAYVQFQTDEVNSEATSLTIRGEATNNAATFVSVARNVSSRPATAASTVWSPPPWTSVGAAGADQRTPSLTPIIQEVVNRPGWVAGNAVALIVTGTGHRTAHAFEFNGVNGAPLLHLSWSTAATNTAPTVNAGPDQTITLPAPATLDGTVTDDGLPLPTTLTTTWTQLTGPGTTTFTNPNTVDTTATFSTAGTYTLRLTANDTALTTTDDITITVNPQPPSNTAPTVNAGPDQTITLPAPATLDGTVTDDGLPLPTTLTTTWTQLTGPGTTTFTNPTTVDTTATFSTAGTYTLRLTANDTALTTTDDITITVNPQPPSNTAPTVNAGPDQTITLPAPATLDGTVTDDGLPLPTTLTTTWTQLTGPGTTTFTNPTTVDTTATFSTAGTYTLRLTANDTALTTTDDITITVNPQPPSNTAPTVNAGPDQTITLPAPATLDGTVTDDGLPLPTTLTTTWTQLTGPGTTTFTNPTTVDTTATFSTAGTYTLRLTANDTALTTTDDITITVNPQPPSNTAPTVNAGPDQTITLPAPATLDGTVTDDGLPLPTTLTTTWTQLTGPGTTTFTNPTTVDTTATFSTAGTYTLRLTANDTALTTTDDITITVNPQPPTDLIFADGFESGTLAAWSSVTGTGDLSASAGAALVGATGLSVRVNDNSPAHVTDNSPNAEARYRARFWFDFGSIVMAQNNVHRIFSAVTANGTQVGRIEIRFTTSTQYQIRVSVLDDTGATRNGAWINITRTRHAVEIDWQASSGPGANSGAASLWIDGVLRSTLTGVNNDAHRIESARLGAVQGIDSGTRGTYAFDAFESRRVTYIGP